MFKIAVDAMGGDYSPGEVVRGSVISARESELGIILVGQKDKIEFELSKYNIDGLDIQIVHTDNFLIEGEQPAYALRTKRNASIAVATKLVREGKANAVFSAGPTGGVIAAALGYLGMVEGISRPVVGGPFVGFAPKTVVLDAGGNLDVRPDQLLDFAIVGTVYAKTILGVTDPTVAILSVGAEEGKGNELVKNCFLTFKNSGLNFIGNVEGNDIPAGKANVIVCDGFIGNILVKFYEGLGIVESKWLEEQLEGKLSSEEVSKICNRLMKLTNVSDSAGGGPIWAVNGLVIKAHGRSKGDDIACGISRTKFYLEKDIVNSLKADLMAVKSKLNIRSS